MAAKPKEVDPLENRPAYFRVIADPLLKVCVEHDTKEKAYSKAALALCLKLGATGWYGRDQWSFPKNKPAHPGWRKGRLLSVSGKTVQFFTPDKRTAAGKAILQELKRLPEPATGMGFVQALMRAYKGPEARGGWDFMRINLTRLPVLGFNAKVGYYLAIAPYWLPKNRTGVLEVTQSEFAEGYKAVVRQTAKDLAVDKKSVVTT